MSDDLIKAALLQMCETLKAENEDLRWKLNHMTQMKDAVLAGKRRLEKQIAENAQEVAHEGE